MTNGIPAVVSEIISGDALTMGQAAALLPAHRGDGVATASSLWRWATHGAKADDGRIVKLETGRFGGRHLTSRAALARFAASLTSPISDEAESPSSVITKTRTQAARLKASEAAARRLAAAGA